MSRTVRVKAPAKINLQLTVGAPGADGYHPLVTVFQALDLWEVVEATPRADGAITVTVEAAPGAPVNVSKVPLDERNLAWQAAELVSDQFGILRGIDLRIIKGVPVAGGMAGGSADAAAALVASAEAWDVGATRAELAELAGHLGADVPFSFTGHTAVGVGRGDQLTRAMSHGQFHWVLATQDQGLSTPEVFMAFDAMLANGQITPSRMEVSQPVMAALIAGDPVALGNALTNDLEAPALMLMPRLREVVESALDAEACAAIVSGSGPTVAALARSRHHALAIAAHMRAAGVADAVVTATGPAPGAVIIVE